MGIGNITVENVGNVIKAINERIADIGREIARKGHTTKIFLGKDSVLYERYETAINKMFPAQMRGESKGGFVKLKNDKATRELLAGDYAEQLNKLYNMDTKGQYLEKKRRIYREKTGKNKPKTRDEKQAETDELKEWLEGEKQYKKAVGDGKIKEKYEELTDDEIATLQQSHNTWQEINAIFSRLNDMVENVTANIGE